MSAVPRQRSSLIFFLFIVLGVALYFNVVGSFFLSDDFHLIYSIKTKGPLGIWSSGSWEFFRPLISLSLFFDYRLWGLNPLGYHLTNIFFHSLNSFLVFLLVLLLLKDAPGYSQVRILAFFSGLLFLIMPHHTEAVSWISGRCDVISAFLFLGSLCGYLRYKECGRRIYLPVSLLFFSGGLLSKESVIILPFLILLFELYHYRGKSNIKLAFPYFAILALYIPLRCLIIERLIGGYGAGLHLNFSPALILNNAFSYSMRSFLFPDPFNKVSFALVSLGVILLLIMKGKNSFAQVKVLWLLISAFAISMAPIINIGGWSADTQGERFIYLPSIFSSIIIICLLGFLITNKKYLIIGFLCLLIPCQASLYKANKNWKTAGKISKGVIDSAGRLGKADTLCILNIPDNIHGAYIYRNGLQEALRLFLPPDRFTGICICLYHNIFEENDAVTILNTPGSAEYAVKLSDQRTFFYPVNIFGRVKARCLLREPEISNSLKNNSYAAIVLQGLKKEDKLLFYSKGTLEELSGKE